MSVELDNRPTKKLKLTFQESQLLLGFTYDIMENPHMYNVLNDMYESVNLRESNYIIPIAKDENLTNAELYDMLVVLVNKLLTWSTFDKFKNVEKTFDVDLGLINRLTRISERQMEKCQDKFLHMDISRMTLILDEVLQEVKRSAEEIKEKAELHSILIR